MIVQLGAGGRFINLEHHPIDWNRLCGPVDRMTLYPLKMQIDFRLNYADCGSTQPEIVPAVTLHGFLYFCHRQIDYSVE